MRIENDGLFLLLMFAAAAIGGLRRHRAGRMGVDVIRALLRLFRRPSGSRALEPIQPRVTPDPVHTAELERRRAELSYRPVSRDGFLLDEVTTRSA